jgi:tetratricopeptide (TPR) repeat protein
MVIATCSSAQQSKLGNVDFPTSGSAMAQAHFLRGLAALHSFWFEEALDAFRESTRAEPDFMMGYWGEAMAHNHPLWFEQETDAARAVVQKIKDTPKLTPKERAYLNAVKVLYGEGDKLSRDKSYAAAMEKIHRQFPDDLETACFYALALLGTVRPEDKGYRRQAQAGAIALDAYQKNPNHPGAAHFIIHAFDDPDHAILALPAARRYAEIAPEAHHARHMPAHIFLQLGMWPEAARSNESAWASAEEWVKRKNLPLSLRDYHSLHWLLYVYLQQGRHREAEQLLGIMKKTMEQPGSEDKLRPDYHQNNYARMAAALIVETERWDRTAELFDFLAQYARAKGSAPGGSSTGHAGHGGEQKPAGQTSITTRRSDDREILPVFIRGLARAMTGKGGVEETLQRLRSFDTGAGDSAYGNETKALQVEQLELAAVAAAARGNNDEALAQMKRAAGLEEDMAPPSGPPALIKPSHELYGEILLRARRAKEAAEQFSISLLRQPNRARSLIGRARAAAMAGDLKTAQETYSTFLRQWQQADRALPELREAENYLKQSSVSR